MTESALAISPLNTTDDKLPALIERAASALSSARSAGEVLEAHDMAQVAYDAARSAARLDKVKRAHGQVQASVHKAQGHALAILSRAEYRLAAEWNAAQADGDVAGHGGARNFNVPAGNVEPTAEDVFGPNARKLIHNARIIQAAEDVDPGIVQRTIDGALETGEAPTKAAVKRAALSVVQATAAEQPEAEMQPVTEVSDSTSSAYVGARVAFPEGVVPSEHIRGGIARERNGAAAEVVAKELGIGVRTYRWCRDIILLSDRHDLGPRDRAAVRSALELLDSTAQIGRAYEVVRPLAERVWGGQGGRTEARESARLEQFDDAISVIVETCERGSEVDIPQLSEKRVKETIKLIRSAESALRTLRDRLGEIHQ